MNEQSIFINNFSHDIDLILIFLERLFLFMAVIQKSGTLLLKNIKSKSNFPFYQINSQKKNWTEKIILPENNKLKLPAALAKNQSDILK